MSKSSLTITLSLVVRIRPGWWVCVLLLSYCSLALGESPGDTTRLDSTRIDTLRNLAPFAHDTITPIKPIRIVQPRSDKFYLKPEPSKTPPPEESGGIGGAIVGGLIGLLFDSHSSENHDYYHPPAKKSRGKLSDAIKKASDENTGNRVVPATPSNSKSRDHQHHSTDFASDRYHSTYGDDVSATNGSSGFNWYGNRESWFSANFGQGTLKTSDFYGYSDFSLGWEGLASQSEPLNRIDVIVGASWAPVQQTSELQHSLDGGVSLLHIGMRYNLYTTPKYTLMGNYLFAGAHLNMMVWDYKNPVSMIEYDDHGNAHGTVMTDSDELTGLELQIGTGWHVAQTNHFAIGIEATPGMILWANETAKGLENDYFSNFFYFRISYMMRVHF